MIYYDSRNVQYKSPFGAVERGRKVRFRVCFEKDYLDASIYLVIYQQDKEEADILMQKEERDRFVLFSAKFVPNAIGLYFYYFRIENNKSASYLKKPEKGGSIGSLSRGEKDTVYQMTVYEKGMTTPDCHKGKIMYQIFPDRFYYSRQKKEDVPSDRILRSDWGGPPFYLPDDNNVLNNDYFCGDLKGIQEKLPYLQELGVTLVYLNPIFEAHSNHRYDTADYHKIDPLLGTNEDFKELCKKAKKYNIEIILDGVFSHTGADSVYFNINGRYDSKGAYNTPESPYSEWYAFHKFPNEYDSWWGFHNLPNIKEETPSYIDFICGKEGVIREWMRMGAAGFRLDVADELPDSFIKEVRKALKAENPEGLLYGEVWEDASNKESYGQKRAYLYGYELDSVMNYPFKDAILQYIKDKNSDFFVEKVLTIVENYPKCTLDVAMNSLSTHDTIRAITILAGESVEYNDRQTQSRKVLSLERYEKGKKLLKLAMVLQYFLPGIPCVYYGDEAGLQGYRDPFNRQCYPWGHEDRELIEFAKMLGKIRLSCPAMATGDIQFSVRDNTGLLSFKRKEGAKETFVFVNTSDVNDIEISPDGLKQHQMLYGAKRDENFLIPAEDFLILKKEQ